MKPFQGLTIPSQELIPGGKQIEADPKYKSQSADCLKRFTKIRSIGSEALGCWNIWKGNMMIHWIEYIFLSKLLVGGVPTPLKNMTSSVGMMKFPTEWKNHPNVPNHQPDYNNSLTWNKTILDHFGMFPQILRNHDSQGSCNEPVQEWLRESPKSMNFDMSYRMTQCKWMQHILTRLLWGSLIWFRAIQQLWLVK